jgi:hypothetical protein
VMDELGNSRDLGPHESGGPITITVLKDSLNTPALVPDSSRETHSGTPPLGGVADSGILASSRSLGAESANQHSAMRVWLAVSRGVHVKLASFQGRSALNFRQPASSGVRTDRS